MKTIEQTIDKEFDKWFDMPLGFPDERLNKLIKDIAKQAFAKWYMVARWPFAIMIDYYEDKAKNT